MLPSNWLVSMLSTSAVHELISPSTLLAYTIWNVLITAWVYLELILLVLQAIVAQLIKRQSCHQIETSILICSSHQLTGFYMMATLAINESTNFRIILLSYRIWINGPNYFSSVNLASKCGGMSSEVTSDNILSKIYKYQCSQFLRVYKHPV